MDWILPRFFMTRDMRSYSFKILSFLFLFYIGPGMIFGQGLAKLVFNKEVHYFDTIPEEGGLASADFTVYNNGNAVLRLLEVKAACGCTSEEWTRDPILPGDSGYIKVYYDPNNRPGYFKKALYVESNDPERVQNYLRIEGYVSPRPKTLEEEYPFQQGGLRFMQKQRTFGYTMPDTILTDTFSLVNVASYPIESSKLKSKYRKPWFTTSLLPWKLESGEKGKMVVKYYPAERDDWGLLFDKVYLATDDPESPVKELVVSLNIQYDFSKLSPEELRNAANMKLSAETFRFERVKAGEKVKTSFVITNSGASQLKLFRASASCDCIHFSLAKEELEPGEHSILEVELDTRDLLGPVHKTITLVSNAPNKHQVILNIIGYVN